jgi:hypothetical protein
MPLQALVDKVAKSRSWSRIGWKIEDEGTSKARIVYEVVTGGAGSVSTREISFNEVCDMFEWKSFSIHPSRQTILIEHTTKHLKDMES